MSLSTSRFKVEFINNLGSNKILLFVHIHKEIKNKTQ